VHDVKEAKEVIKLVAAFMQNDQEAV